MIDHRIHISLNRIVAVVMLACISTLAYATEEDSFISSLTLEPPSEPLLQIESRRHQGLVTAISTDSKGRFLVTASEDKTLRLWRIEDGKLLHTYRMPHGSENQGKLYAAAISPDGCYLAAGGYLEDARGFHFSIFIINRKTNKVVKHIRGLENLANHLVFSHDGHFMAGLFGASGLKVWDVMNDFTEVAKDTDYQNDTYWADFSSRGELVTTSQDGFVRLYDKSFKLKNKSQVLKGNIPVGASFSPDGQEVVVGFLQKHSIVIVSAKDLSIVYKPDISGIALGDIAVVKWGKDGVVYAGGNYVKHGMVQIRRWADGGRGEFRDMPCSESIVMDFSVLSAGRVISVDNKPDISLISGDGQLIYRLSNNSALRTIVGSELFISANGATAAVTLWGKEGVSGRVRFDAIKLKLDQITDKQKPLHGSKVTSSYVSVKHWHGSSSPTVNGASLNMDIFEMSNALTISEDDSFFILGTNQALRKYDRNGTLMWKNNVSKSIRSVNVSTNGKIVVAVLSDDTMRWYNTENGEELLALYIHADRKRWVAWTPKGYFSHSTNGGGLVGYSVSSDKESLASFISFSSLDKQMMRPDKLRALIRGEQVDNAGGVLYRSILDILARHKVS